MTYITQNILTTPPTNTKVSRVIRSGTTIVTYQIFYEVTISATQTYRYVIYLIKSPYSQFQLLKSDFVDPPALNTAYLKQISTSSSEITEIEKLLRAKMTTQMAVYTKITEALAYEPYYVLTFVGQSGDSVKITILYDFFSRVFRVVSFEQTKTVTQTNADGYVVV